MSVRTGAARPTLPTLALVAVVLTGCPAVVPNGTAAPGTATATPGEATATSSPAVGTASVAELARAVVQIIPFEEDGDELSPVWSGSGTIVSPDGLILTNAHVVDERFDEWDVLGIAVTQETDELPELAYRAEILAVDYPLDLAVIAIVSDFDGDPVDELELPYVETGDSEAVEIGDEVRILGYPGIGGATITLTRGAVSGFTGERDVDGRAWIKTDATIAGGNSGGLAVDAAGRLIGIPTVVGAGGDTDFVDCRLLEDTDGDGRITEEDTCIPVGGFINGLRPVNLALPLIEAAERGEEYESPGDGDVEDFDASEIVITNVVFAPDVTEDDEPTETVQSVPSGSPQVCAFWDYEGMADGVNWDALWYADGELDEEGSFIGDAWGGGASGSWWVCTIAEDGLPDGVYEFVIAVEGDTVTSNAVFVGGEREIVSFEIVNDSSAQICYAQLSPTGAQYWGPDDLGPETTIPAGESHTVEIAMGTYDVLLRDCDLEVLLEEYEVEVDGDMRYTVMDG